MLTTRAGKPNYFKNKWLGLLDLFLFQDRCVSERNKAETYQDVPYTFWVSTSFSVKTSKINIFSALSQNFVFRTPPGNLK